MGMHGCTLSTQEENRERRIMSSRSSSTIQYDGGHLRVAFVFNPPLKTNIEGKEIQPNGRLSTWVCKKLSADLVVCFVFETRVSPYLEWRPGIHSVDKATLRLNDIYLPLLPKCQCAPPHLVKPLMDFNNSTNTHIPHLKLKGGK